MNIAQIRSATTNWSATGATTSSSSSASPSSATTAGTPTELLADPRQLDANLHELALISQRASLFYSFIHDRANDELERSETTQGKENNKRQENGLSSSSGLAKRVKGLLNSSYLVMDEYLLKRNVDKAMRMDQSVAADGEISTCVDDVFFILKKVIRRCITTSEPDVMAATVGTILKVLDAGYLQVFQQKMAVAFAGQEPRGSERSTEQAKIQYMV